MDAFVDHATATGDAERCFFLVACDHPDLDACFAETSESLRNLILEFIVHSCAAEQSLFAFEDTEKRVFRLR